MSCMTLTLVCSTLYFTIGPQHPQWPVTKMKTPFATHHTLTSYSLGNDQHTRLYLLQGSCVTFGSIEIQLSNVGKNMTFQPEDLPIMGVGSQI